MYVHAHHQCIVLVTIPVWIESIFTFAKCQQLLRAILQKKIYPQQSSNSTLSKKTHLEDRHITKSNVTAIEDQLVQKGDVSDSDDDDGSKWDKSDSECKHLNMVLIKLLYMQIHASKA